MKEFPPACTTLRVRLRGKKQNLEESTFFMDWKGKYGTLQIPIFLIAREIILSLNKIIFLL